MKKTKLEFSDRLLEVLALIAEGLSNKEIADKLFISESTVGTHIMRLSKITNLHNRTQLAVYAVRHKLI